MKKLVLILLLMFSLEAVSQNRQIVKDYSVALSTSSEGVKGEWIEIHTRIFFNYGGQNDKVKIYLGNQYFTYTQIDRTETARTEGGFLYQKLYLIGSEGETMLLQVFEDEEFGVRFIFKDFSTVQVTN